MKTLACTALLGLLLPLQSSRGASTEIVAIDGAEAKILGQVTGLHTIRHRASELEARLLEADGSASVAQDPIALFLVVANNGTSDLQEYVWRLPRGVARVRSLSETTCGVDARIEIDGRDNPAPKTISRVLHLCFLSADGHLTAKLKFVEEAVAVELQDRRHLGR